MNNKPGNGTDRAQEVAAGWEALNALMAVLPDPAMIVDSSGVIVSINPAGALAWGIDRADAGRLGDPDARTRLAHDVGLRYPDGRPVAPEYLPSSRALNGNPVVAEPYLFRDASGREQQVSISAAPIRRNGSLESVAVIWREVTEREALLGQLTEREVALQARTAELEAIPANLPDAVYVGDEDGIVHCNQRALDDLGCDGIEELQDRIPALNEKLQNRYADTGERIRPEDEAFARALRGQPWTYEVISRNLKTGQEVIQRCAANPIVLDGRVIGAVAINTNITEQKRTEAALREAVRELSKREIELAGTAERLREAHAQLERRVQERTAQLEAEVRQRQEVTQQLRSLSRQLVQVQEDERRSLARDLHDTSGQAMTALKLGLAMLKREDVSREALHAQINELSKTAETVAEDLHRLAINLRPASLDRYGLVPALEGWLVSVRRQTGIDINFLALGMDARLSGDMETALFRIVQEGCTNIARYAEAAHASVLVQREGHMVRCFRYHKREPVGCTLTIEKGTT